MSHFTWFWTQSACVVILMQFACLSCFSGESPDYEEELQKTLKREWTKAGHIPGKAPSLRFNISKNGQITKLTIHKSSGDKKLDQDGLNIVRRLVPLKSPPVGVTEIRTIFADVDYAAILGPVQAKIKRNWTALSKSDSNSEFQVSFKLHESGAVSDVKIIKSTGDKRVGDSLVRAILNSAPFDALPEGAPSFIDVKFSMNYHVFDGKLD